MLSLNLPACLMPVIFWNRRLEGIEGIAIRLRQGVSRYAPEQNERSRYFRALLLLPLGKGWDEGILTLAGPPSPNNLPFPIPSNQLHFINQSAFFAAYGIIFPIFTPNVFRLTQYGERKNPVGGR